MKIKHILKHTEKLVVDNSPGILTAIGVTGTVTTAYLTGKASFKAAQILEMDEVWSVNPFTRNRRIWQTAEMTTKDKISFAWPFYTQAAATGGVTIAAIIGANRIGTRRAAALATAYAISEKAFVDYKDKVVETIGKKQEQSIRDEVAQDRVDKNPTGEREVIIIGSGEVLFYDAFSGRYFMSNMESVKKAMNDTNYLINSNFYASLSDFYNKVGLPTTSYSEEVGWNSDNLIDIDFSTTMSDDERPCISIDFRVVPVRDYFRVH